MCIVSLVPYELVFFVQNILQEVSRINCSGFLYILLELLLKGVGALRSFCRDVGIVSSVFVFLLVAIFNIIKSAESYSS